MRSVARSQESVAVSNDGDAWFIVNASPDIRQQIENFPSLHPRGPRHSPILAILLTSGDLDHCLGLLSLRESYPLVVYATEQVRRGFTEGNGLYRTLQRFPGQVTWRPLRLGCEESLAGGEGSPPSGLVVKAVAVPGKVPIHLNGSFLPDPEDNVGFWIREESTGCRLAYVPGAAAITQAMRDALNGVDIVFFDGTFWTNDELLALGVGTKRAEEMAHLPVWTESGSLRALARLTARRRVYTHLNNTNPLLVDSSPERSAVRAAGWEVAWDGMDIGC